MVRLKTGRKSWPSIILAVCLAVHLPRTAFAVQVHGGHEGLYVHMMAHVFFSAALVYLLFILWEKPIGRGRGWFHFKCSLYFFLLWNIDTFVVHWLSFRLPEEALVVAGPLWEHRLSYPLSFERLVLYIGKFDHLLNVPAIIFLMLSLRAFCREAEQSRAEAKS
jgi:hypothetical protein